MASDDLVLAAIASRLIQPQTLNQPTAPQPPAPVAGITAEQLNAIAQAVSNGVQAGLANVQLPAINVQPPEVNVPLPNIQIPPTQVTFPENLRLSFSDEELARLGTAVAMASAGQPKLIETRVLTLDADGTAVNSTFPVLRRLVTYQFTQSYQLIALSLSCSIVNTTTNVAGLFVGRDLGEFANIQQQSDTDTASDIFISQLTHQNSTLATIAPLSRTNTVGFSGDREFVQIQGGSRLAVYGCGDNDVNNLYSAVVNLHLVAPNG